MYFCIFVLNYNFNPLGIMMRLLAVDIVECIFFLI